jgi:hypothetical protein
MGWDGSGMFRDVKSAIESWIEKYKTDWLHQELGCSVPAEYREKREL